MSRRGSLTSADWLEQVLDGVGDAVVSVDRHGNVMSMNAEARRVLGAETATADARWAAARQRLRTATGEPIAPENLPLMRALRGNATREQEFLLLSADGASSLLIETQARPLRNEQGEIIGAVCSFRDVTEKKEVEDMFTRDADRLCALAAEVDDARRAAERANQYKSRFLAGMSHELRTPLNAVIGFSELLEQEVFGALNSKQAEYVQYVLSSGRHLLAIVNDILDLSKVEAGRFEIQRDFTPLQAIVDSALSVVESLRIKYGVDIVCELPRDLPDLYVDSVRIKQVLYNLLTNAVKFSPRGGSVTLSAVDVGGVLELSVRDHGVGILLEDQPKLFREFEQLTPQSSDGKMEGTGLGLALTKKLVELHGGSVGVESAYGQGSRFWVQLPLLDFSGNPLAETDKAQRCVLIVEDDPLSAEVIGQQLRSLHLASLNVRDAEQARQALRGLSPVAITIDIMIPRADGWALLSLLKSDPQTRDIPVIIISGVDEPQRALSMGAVGSLHKPFARAELVEALTRAGVLLPSDLPPSSAPAAPSL